MVTVTKPSRIIAEKTSLIAIGVGAISSGIMLLPTANDYFGFAKSLSLIALGIVIVAWREKLKINSRWGRYKRVR